MIIFLVVAIVLMVLVFGVASIAQSISSAQQAQATIEVAKANQMATFANAVVIVTVVLLLAAILLALVYLILSRQHAKPVFTPRIVGVDMARGRDASKAVIVRAPASSNAAYLGRRPGQFPEDIHAMMSSCELTEYEQEFLDYLENRQ